MMRRGLFLKKWGGDEQIFFDLARQIRRIQMRLDIRLLQRRDEGIEQERLSCLNFWELSLPPIAGRDLRRMVEGMIRMLLI